MDDSQVLGSGVGGSGGDESISNLQEQVREFLQATSTNNPDSDLLKDIYNGQPLNQHGGQDDSSIGDQPSVDDDSNDLVSHVASRFQDQDGSGSGGGGGDLSQRSAKRNRRKANGDEAPANIGKYQIIHNIGTGYLGNTYSATLLDSSEYVTLKRIDVNRINLNQQTIIKREYEILKTLSHQNIVNYILDCLFYIHSQDMIHRNLKASNILLAKGGRCKLSDFGLGCTMGSTFKHSIVGEPFWYSPEILLMKEYNFKVDVWGVGCLILELLTGKPPCFNLSPMEALIQIVDSTKAIELPADISKDLKAFLGLCFEKDPLKRASIEQLMQHSWMSSSGTMNGNESSFSTLLNQPQPPSSSSTHPQKPRGSENYSIDFLSLVESNQHDIDALHMVEPSSIHQQVLSQSKFKEPTNKSASAAELLEILNHNLTIGTQLKNSLQQIIQEEKQNYFNLVQMKSKVKEILDQNKTGARISAHSNMLLKRTNQMASELTKKNENFKNNIKRLEDYLLTKDDCAKKLANVVYKQKITFDNLLNPTLAAPVQYQIGTKVWKKGQEKKSLAILKDNFIFYFKNDKNIKTSYPMDVVYLNDKKSINVSSSQDSAKKKSFFISIGTIINDLNSDQDLNNSSADQSVPNQTTPSSSSSSSSTSQQQSTLTTSQANSVQLSSQAGPTLVGGSISGLSNQQQQQLVGQNNNNNPSTSATTTSGSNTSASGIKEKENSILWCIMAFENQKDMENWLGVLESSVSWYERKPNEISTKPTLSVAEKKHQKTKSGDKSTTNLKSGVEESPASLWKKENSTKFPGVFGVPLEDLMSRENPNAEIPSFITKIINFLERNIQEEGILRISGSSTEIQDLKSTLQKGENIEYHQHRDTHAVAGLLKLFLRELPDSLFPTSLRLHSSEIIADRNIGEADKIFNVIELFKQIPKHDYNLLKHMIRFAKRVTEQSDHNKMVLANVTTCFAQSLKGLIPGLFTFCILNYDQVFITPALKYASI
ncbi:putative protein serine/threonine kinase [Cavenderia fasciculata]|uniref:Protein kinase domain-containing protein n=1 Tax=Cavenderia fasciculata TaxID=261658 RepID=F4PHC5_CACFS|nr:putative protein serine/threonine kinase [Cavenderia fasciculata]EGG25109.1 putative protein serine/threonine kinase [Cavenderia fasciculata]|eukprot:XP_004362960.1 putative protein serine/threonine kinase [Cavenderia fasciculata]